MYIYIYIYLHTQGEDEQRYIDQHPILNRVPPTHRLFIISKISIEKIKPSPSDEAAEGGGGEGQVWGQKHHKRITFWLQLRADERIVKFYKGVLELGAALESDYNPLRGRFEVALLQALSGRSMDAHIFTRICIRVCARDMYTYVYA